MIKSQDPQDPKKVIFTVDRDIQIREIKLGKDCEHKTILKLRDKAQGFNDRIAGLVNVKRSHVK